MIAESQIATDGLRLHPYPMDPLRAQPAAAAASTATGFQSGQCGGGRSNFASKVKKAARWPARISTALAGLRRARPGRPPPPRPSDQSQGGRLVWSTGRAPNWGSCAPTRAMQAETRHDHPLAAEIAHTSPRAHLGPAYWQGDLVNSSLTGAGLRLQIGALYFGKFVVPA